MASSIHGRKMKPACGHLSLKAAGKFSGERAMSDRANPARLPYNMSHRKNSMRSTITFCEASMKSLNILVSAIAISSAGCASNIATTYSGESRAKNEIAVLIGGKTESAGQNYWASFAGYTELKEGSKPTHKSVTALFSYPKELHMLPGEYSVMLFCSTPRGYANPSISIRVAATEKYQVGCEPVPNLPGIIRATATKIKPEKAS